MQILQSVYIKVPLKHTVLIQKGTGLRLFTNCIRLEWSAILACLVLLINSNRMHYNA
jgi:hypothetical protein